MAQLDAIQETYKTGHFPGF